MESARNGDGALDLFRGATVDQHRAEREVPWSAICDPDAHVRSPQWRHRTERQADFEVVAGLEGVALFPVETIAGDRFESHKLRRTRRDFVREAISMRDIDPIKVCTKDVTGRATCCYTATQQEDPTLANCFHCREVV